MQLTIDRFRPYLTALEHASGSIIGHPRHRAYFNVLRRTPKPHVPDAGVRLTRLTNAFSKKLCNLKSALALPFVHYNFVRVYSTLKVAPAVVAGLERHTWNLSQ